VCANLYVIEKSPVPPATRRENARFAGAAA